MGQDIKFAIEEVRAAGTKFTAHGQAFRENIIGHLDQLNLPGNAFPAWDMGLQGMYEQARSATSEVSKAAEETLTSIGKALAAVATFYEDVEKKHAKELGITP